SCALFHPCTSPTHPKGLAPFPIQLVPLAQRFQLSMDGSTSIGYGRSNLYRSDTVKGNTVPINIYARTRTYAGKVTAGETMSRVKVVIDYN
ncbi:hypothetical protein V4S77_26280, partial [Citrobacter freundii]